MLNDFCENFSIFSLIFVGIGTGFFSCLFSFCLEEGNVFSFWAKAIAYLPLWLAKPLGFCIICFNFWLGCVVFVLHFDLSLVGFITFQGFSYASLKMLSDSLRI